MSQLPELRGLDELTSQLATTPARRQISGARIYHEVKEDAGYYPPAGGGERLFSFAIDLTLQGSIAGLIRIPFSGYIAELEHAAISSHLDLIVWAISAVAVAVYTILPVWMTGQTLGKRAYGLRVVQRNGQTDLSLPQVVWRETVTKGFGIVTGLILTGILRQDRRAFHDFLSDTKVIQYRGNEWRR